MAGCVNRHIIIGNLGADPEIRSTQDGKVIANLRVATTDTWRDKQSGERREATQWHSVAIFSEHLVKIAQQYLKKGSKVYICGPSQTRKWKDQSGNDRYTTEIVLQNFNGELTLLDSRQSENRDNPPQLAQNSIKAPANKYPGRSSHEQAKDWDDTGDSIPWLE